METPDKTSIQKDLYQLLDIPELFSLFSKYYHFTSNKESLLGMQENMPLKKVKYVYDIQDFLQELEEAELQAIGKNLRSTPSALDFSNISKKIEKSHTLEEEELYHLAKFYRVLKFFIKETSVVSLIDEHLFNHFNKDKELRSIFKELDPLLDEDEQAIDFARHPILKPIAKKIFQQEKTIRKEIKSVEGAWFQEGFIQQSGYDYVDQKYVLPVRSDRFNHKLGTIIYRSQTGQTLYVEPRSIELLVNNKKEDEAHFEREKFKILDHYTKQLYINKSMISSGLKAVKFIDQMHAAVLINTEYQLTRPDLFDRQSSIDLEDTFHPMLEKPVKNTIQTADESSGFLISGPNTGGKTILLKTVALNLVLPRFGFFVPAQKASIPFSMDIFFFAHDNQDIQEGLSSFSSEVTNYLSIFPKLKRNSFVFIDEIFNSTSSSDASQIAMALIKAFKNKKTKIFISSHHEHLKEEVFSSQELQSAHMGFDKTGKNPTYKCFFGVPGHSFAIDIFKSIEQKLLNNPQISIHLHKNSQSSYTDLDSRIKSINMMEANLHKIEQDNLILKRQLESDRKSIQGVLTIEKNKLQDAYQQKWQKMKQEVFDLCETIKAEQKTNINAVANDLADISSELQEEAESETKVKNYHPTNQKIEPGIQVISKNLNQEGKVLKVNGGKAFVQFKNIKSWVPIKSLASIKSTIVQAKRSQTTFERSPQGMTYDARGVRRDIFLNELEERVYDVLNEDVPFLDIIHGHGDGILKKALNEFLRNFKDIARENIDGNLGSTRIYVNKKS